MTREICPPQHKHDQTRTCYAIHRCGCTPCRDAATASERQRRKLKAYGRYDPGLVDITPVREHIQKLRDYGIGWKRVAELAGVGNTAVETIIYGHKTRGGLNNRINRVNAAKILAVEPCLENMRPGALIPAIGAQRRVQALVWQGWSMLKLSQMLGFEASNLNLLMKRDEITVRNHLKIQALYEQLWDKPRPVTRPHDKTSIARARNLAARKGWVSGMAWENIDNPRERPKGIPAREREEAT